MKRNVKKRIIAFVLAFSVMLGNVYGYANGLQVQAQESVSENSITSIDNELELTETTLSGNEVPISNVSLSGNEIQTSNIDIIEILT